MENIPENILEWMEKIPFSGLTAIQQKEVLQYYSEAEYTGLHNAAIQAQEFFKPGSVVVPAHMETSLNNRFDEVYNQPAGKKPVTIQLLSWKIAAAVLLLAVGILSFRLIRAEAPQQVVQTVYDTVYFEKQGSLVEMIHDTIFITLPGKNKSKNITAMADTGARTLPGTVAGMDETLPAGRINTLSILDKDKGPNALKNQSIANDTFVKQFDYVTL